MTFAAFSIVLGWPVRRAARQLLRSLHVAAPVVAGAVVSSAVAGSPCGPDSGPCDVAHGTPGCDEVSCCTAVCAFQPTCCEIEWDALCVDLRDLFPDDCTGAVDPACGPGTGPCFLPNSTPGCEDKACCDQVCAVDAFCCQQGWDILCASIAAQFCPLWPCGVECPNGALDEGEPCGELVNEGCNGTKGSFVALPLDTTICGTIWASGQMRDTDWFLLDVPKRPGSAKTEVAIVVTAEPATAVLLFDPRGCPLSEPIFVTSAFGGGCVPIVIDVKLVPRQYAIVVTTGLAAGPLFEGFPCGTLNAYTIAASALGSRPECAADLDGDGKVTGADLGILLQQWGGDGPADLDRNGVVDGGDLGLLLQSWGPC